MRTITVLLTRYSGKFEKFVSPLYKGGYTHSSLSIDGTEEVFYSFTYHGFAVEYPKRYFPKNRLPGSLCIRFQVTDDAYARIEETIAQFKGNRRQYAFTHLGSVLCMLGIPHKFKNRYICSQFVAETLFHAGAVSLSKSPSLYMPSDLVDEMEPTVPGKQLIHDAI